LNEQAASDAEDDIAPFVKKLVPFKAFSAYANYPFSLDSDSDDADEDGLQGQGEDVNMDITPSAEEPLSASMMKKTQRTAMTVHEREVKLLQLEKKFMRNFVSEYKDLPALVHTYGFALQCLVNVGVRGSESIRTRVVEAGVLGVVARILSGFLDYRATEREKRQKIITAAQVEKDKEKELSIQINGANGNSSRRDRDRHTSTNTSGESDVTAVLTMSTRRERRERDHALLAHQAQTLAMAQAQISAHQHQYSLAQAQAHQTQSQNQHHHTTPLVAGMPAPPNAAAVTSTTLVTPRQTRSAAVQALLNSNTEMPTRAPRQYTSTMIPPTTTRISPRRAGSSSSTASSSSVHHHQAINTNLSSTTSSSATTVAAISSLVAGSIMINRTNTPDTIASLDEVQEFSDVNPDENESTTSSGQEENGTASGSIDVDSMMDVIGSGEAELQATSAMVLGNDILSNPASRSVSRNRINANVLAQHRPVPPPSSRLHEAITPIEPVDSTLASAPASQQLEVTLTQVQAPSMLGDVTIKLSSEPQDNEQDDDEEEEDVVMERDNDREDHESTDDTGTSASPVSRPASSHYMRHHQTEPTSPSSSIRRTTSTNTSSTSTRRSTHHPTAAQQMTRSESTNALLDGTMMDSETTPISRPVPLRRQSSSSVVDTAATAPTVVSATPRNAFSTTTITNNHALQQEHYPQSQVPSVSYNYLSHVDPPSSRLETHLRSQTLTAHAPSASQEHHTPTSSSNTTRQPHTSVHAHLRLHPHLQQSAAAQPSIMRDGHAHLLLNYGPLMDHYVKEEDVLHCLHLLAYLSKYPHVRAVFHDPENEICRPPSSSSSTSALNPTAGNSEAGNPDASMVSNGTVTGNATTTRSKCCSCARKKIKFGGEEPSADDGGVTSSSASAASMSAAEDGDHNMSDSACHGHCHAHAAGDTSKVHSRSTSSGSQKHGHPCCANQQDDGEDQEEAESLARARAMATMPAKDRRPALEPSRPPRSTANNVFSLVEQYTFRPSSPADRSMRLGTDIQYWAGVIMRNACRKDELRGGIRQCANMGCGVWERFPREFAKCRRCRKAKYCSKGCQRRAWQAGHRLVSCLSTPFEDKYADSFDKLSRPPFSQILVFCSSGCTSCTSFGGWCCTCICSKRQCCRA